MVVVLPAPFGPRKANTSPLSTCRSTSSTATKLPYVFLSPLTVMALDITCPPLRVVTEAGIMRRGRFAPSIKPSCKFRVARPGITQKGIPAAYRPPRGGIRIYSVCVGVPTHTE